jgi:hypothetical protein
MVGTANLIGSAAVRKKKPLVRILNGLLPSMGHKLLPFPEQFSMIYTIEKNKQNGYSKFFQRKKTESLKIFIKPSTAVQEVFLKQAWYLTSRQYHTIILYLQKNSK